MTRPNEHDTILADPALAGHTLLIRREGRWLARDIHTKGFLDEGRVVRQVPLADSWRGGWNR